MPGKGGRRGKCGKHNQLPARISYFVPFVLNRSYPFALLLVQREREKKKKHSRYISEEKPEHVTYSTCLLNYRFAPRPVPSARLSPFQWFIRGGMEVLYLFARLSLHIYHTSSRRNVDWRIFPFRDASRRPPLSSIPVSRAKIYPRAIFRSHGRHYCSHVTLTPLAHGVLTHGIATPPIHSIIRIGIMRIKKKIRRTLWETREKERAISGTSSKSEHFLSQEVIRHSVGIFNCVKNFKV